MPDGNIDLEERGKGCWNMNEGETQLKVLFFFSRFRNFNHQRQISPRQETCLP